MDFLQNRTDRNSWLGEVGGLVVYSHIGFGWTQAYDIVNHTIIWENPQLVLKEVIGVSEDTLVGLAWQPHSAFSEPPTIIVGLDPETGTELWRSEPGKVETVQLMQGRLFYLLSKGDSPIRFVEPRSGEPIVDIAFDQNPYADLFISVDGMILAVNLSHELVLITP